MHGQESLRRLRTLQTADSLYNRVSSFPLPNQQAVTDASLAHILADCRPWPVQGFCSDQAALGSQFVFLRSSFREGERVRVQGLKA